MIEIRPLPLCCSRGRAFSPCLQQKLPFGCFRKRVVPVARAEWDPFQKLAFPVRIIAICCQATKSNYLGLGFF